MPRSDSSALRLCCGMAGESRGSRAPSGSGARAPVPVPSLMPLTGAVADVDKRRRWYGRAQLSNMSSMVVVGWCPCRIRRSDVGMLLVQRVLQRPDLFISSL
ncbi:hypothetical protein PVAP13_5KG424707 [Panicum virgatum]|uniref:Uncharacterized protein n=1 Tax=Panicum virgatum TaxID=38727 RepID=A0A8T0SRJ2_PANVG|nr:hypothetical protein PVAP13_5KG424707 [Panicum virgatum]